LLAVCREVETAELYETACRLRSICSAVFRYAIVTGRAERDPAADLRGALIAPTVTHRAAITKPAQVRALLRAIDSYEGREPTVRLALQLLALTFPRPSELRRAEWSEIDFDGAVWKIPASRMKMRIAHRIPLAKQTLTLLRELHAVTGDGCYLFPSFAASTKPMSEGAFIGALRRLGYTHEEMTAHGFRAMAATLLNESGKWNADAIERQLAHQEADTVRRAYARGEHWEERVRMMQWWADQLENLKNG
jgi:integrase